MEPLDRQQLRPIDQPGLVRIGRTQDGGYVVPAAQTRGTSTLLSLGLHEDWSFDRAFVAAHAGARVIGVDHSIGPRWFRRRLADSLAAAVRSAIGGDRRSARKHLAAFRTALDYFVFFRPPHRHIQKRAAGASDPSSISLAALLETAGRGAPHSVFVKIDIEGGEYDLVPALVDAADVVNGVVIEFHKVGRRTAEFNRAIARLLTSFHIVHIHGNNYGPFDSTIAFPDTLEITFLHRMLTAAPAVPSPHTYPRPGLDRPNRRGHADYPLCFE